MYQQQAACLVSDWTLPCPAQHSTAQHSLKPVPHVAGLPAAILTAHLYVCCWGSCHAAKGKAVVVVTSAKGSMGAFRTSTTEVTIGARPVCPALC
jgi:hypothetical protein